MKRRGFLKTTALGLGGLVVIGAGGLAARGAATGAFGDLYDGPAFEPWSAWREKRFAGGLRLVNAGLLAASPHNTQPWAFRLQENRLEMLADAKRTLGPLDPYWREMTIGLGCAVENIVSAAAGEGYRLRGGLFPVPAQRELVLRLEFEPGGDPLELARYDAIAQRHTNRGPYDTARQVPVEAIERLAKLVDSEQGVRLILLRADSDSAKLFSRGTVKATEDIVADEELMAASSEWERHGLSEISEERDGISLLNAGLPEPLLRGLLMSPWLPDSLWRDGWVKATREVHCATAGFFGALAVRPPLERRQLLEAGRLWQRIHLEAAGMGLAMQPLNQLMEMADRDRLLARPSRAASTLSRLAGGSGWQIVFGFRGGYPENAAPPSPRRGVSAVVLES